MRFTRIVFFLLFIQIGLGLGGPAYGQAAMQIAASFSLRKQAITQMEPPIVDITFENHSASEAVVSLGRGDNKLDITVVDPNGTIRKKPQSLPSGWGNADVFYVPQGGVSKGSISLNEWFSFPETGTYEIKLRVSPESAANEHSTYSLSADEAYLRLTVSPRDEGILRQACAALLAQVQNEHVSPDSLTAAKALSSINDPVAVGYIVDAIGVEPFRSMMIAALARIRTTQAIDGLVAASRSHDPETSAQAKAALGNIKTSNEK